MNHIVETDTDSVSVQSEAICRAAGDVQGIPQRRDGMSGDLPFAYSSGVTDRLGDSQLFADGSDSSPSEPRLFSERLTRWLNDTRSPVPRVAPPAAVMSSEAGASPTPGAIRVDGAALAGHLMAEAASVVKAIFDRKDVAPAVATSPLVLIRHGFDTFEIDLTLAIAGMVGAYPMPIRGDVSDERAIEQGLVISCQMNAPTPRQLIELLNRPIAIILVAGERDVLPQEVQVLVREEVRLERFTGASLSAACRTLYQIAETADFQDEPWMRHVRPEDFLSMTWVPAPDTTPAQAVEMIAASLASRVQRRMCPVPVESSLALDEIDGVDEARQWAEALIEDIRLATLGPAHGGIAWSEVDRGALLTGPTGTGKTTLARAIAQAAGLPFIVASAAQWAASGRLNEHLVAIRETFSQVEQVAPAFLFIDEIDSLGTRTGLGSDGNSQYVREVINCVLEQLDGFRRRGRVIVLAATNDIAAVDPALRRSGRLDRVIPVPRPDAAARTRILRRYLSAQRHTVSAAELDALGLGAVGLTGADLEQIVRTAGRRARRDNGRPIQADDLRRLILRLPEKEAQRAIDPALLYRICVHEAGHALVTLLGADGGTSLQHVSTLSPTEEVGGFVLCLPNIECAMARGEYLLDQICAALAGRAAEALVFGERNIGIGSGGSDPGCDLATATKMAGTYVTQFGFSRSGSLAWRPSLPPHDANLMGEVEGILSEQYGRAGALLALYRNVLDVIAEELAVRHDMSGDEVREIARNAGLSVAANDSHWSPSLSNDRMRDKPRPSDLVA
jgi:cell division protease FtsH